jgi:hypothetical protein
VTVAYVGTQGHGLLSDLESNPGNPCAPQNFIRPIP